MLEPKIAPQDLETWANFLIQHSLGGIEPGDRVMIKGERIGWPLMALLERKVIEGGGLPDVLVVAPNNDRGRIWSAAMGAGGKPEQLAGAPDWHRQRYEWFNKYVEVLGAEDPAQFRGLSPAQMQSITSADRPFTSLRISKKWVITLFPTPAMAAQEGMDFEEYTRFLVRASTTDPRPLRDAEERLTPLFRDCQTITVVTEHPQEKRELTLRLDIESSIPSLSYGLRNHPDGEIFTSPNANRVEGEIFLDLPLTEGGNDIEGVYLKLEGGRIVNYSARRGHAHLASIIETDAGSHRLGEIALGMNPGIDRVLKHPLLVEKVGGTVHVAIGASYEHCYVTPTDTPEGKQRIAELKAAGVINESAQHVDIVADFRPGGCGRRVLFDGRPVVIQSGLWIPG